MSCLNCDDKAYWEAQVPIIAAKDLDKFLAAAKEGDKKSIGNLFQSLLSTVKSAQANNEVLLPRIKWIVTRTAAFANSDLGVFQRAGLYSLVRLVNGKRDNKSYYTLDAVREWITRRLSSVTGKLNADMTDVQARAVDSRDFLDSHAQVFVAGIKELVRLTAGDTLKNAPEIRSVANSMLADVKEIPVLTQKTQGLLDAVQHIIDSQK